MMPRGEFDSRSHPKESDAVDPPSRESATIKILIVAEHASAKFGGEALIPLQYFRFLRKLDVDVRLVVHERTRSELEHLLPRDADRIHYIEDSWINLWCNSLSRFLPERVAEFTLGALSHFHTQIRQRRLARHLIKRFDLDIVHEPIPVSPKIPSFTYGLGVPVVIGPMNGGIDYPKGYEEGILEQQSVNLMRGFSGVLNRFIPGKRKADILLVANERTRAALPKALQAKPLQYLCENGVDLDVFPPAERIHEAGVARLIVVGRMVRFKRIDLVLAACAKLPKSVAYTLDIIGDGPLRAELESEALRLGIAGSVVFRGRQAQPAIATALAKADIFVMPSMRDCGGAVVLEAMATSLPVIAAAWGGPLDYLDAESGILIEPASPSTFVDSLAASIAKLAENPSFRVQLGRAARRRVERHFDWNVKAKRVLAIYSEVLEAEVRPFHDVHR